MRYLLHQLSRSFASGARTSLWLLCIVASALLASALLASTRLAAQPADVRISPPDDPLHVFAADAKIQSAARIGTRTLVAWGTTVPDSIAFDATKTTYHNELYFEMLAGTDRTGMPQHLHEPEARPYDVVAVVNLRDRFLVLWNDRRDGAAGIYARTVDTTGAILGSPYRLAPGAISGEDAVWITPVLDGGYLLVWGDNTGSTTRYFRTSLDRNAHGAGAIDEIVQTNFDNDMTFDELPGAHILRDSSGGRFVHASGDTDARIVPGRFLYEPHYLAADTSIVVVEPDTGLVRWITFYRSAFNTAIVRHVKLVLPDGPVATCALARDSIGRTIVLINQHVIDSHGYFGYINGRLVRYVLGDNGTLGDSTDIAGAYIWSYARSTSRELDGGLNWYTLISGDRNAVRFTYAYSQYSWEKQPGIGSTSHTTTILTLDGGAHLYTLDPAVQAYASGSTRERIAVSRRSVTDSSAVRVQLEATIARDVAVAIPPTPRHFEHTGPAMAYLGDTLLVAWRSTQGVDHFGIARWMDTSVADVVALPALDYPVLASTTSFQRLGVLWRWNDFFAVSYTSIYGYYVPTAHMDYPAFAYQLAVPTAEGFKNRQIESDPCTPWQITHSYDPDSGRITGVLEGCSFNGRYITTDRSGLPIRTETLDAVHPSAVLSFSQQRYVLIGNDSARCYAQSHRVTIRELRRTPTPSAERYQRLNGDRFLRIYPEHGINANHIMPDRLVTLETYDADVRLLFTTALVAPSNRYDLFVYERARDSALIVVWGSEDGVHLTVIDSRLHVQVIDEIVSATRSRAYAPVCSVHGATFVAAWEDYRNGNADVYGTMWDVDQLWNGTIHIDHGADSAEHGSDSTMTRRPITGAGAIVVRQVVPLPADAWLRVEFTTERDEEIIIDVVDMAGRRVDGAGPLAARHGSSSAMIPTRAFHPGAYTVVIRTGTGASVCVRAVVVH